MRVSWPDRRPKARVHWSQVSVSVRTSRILTGSIRSAWLYFCVGKNEDPLGDNPDVPGGFTYLGQFIDHDITLDVSSLQEMLVDPLCLENFRTPMLDLDAVYGSGPVTQPYLDQHLTASTRQKGGRRVLHLALMQP
jgi:hypothetical protein